MQRAGDCYDCQYFRPIEKGFRLPIQKIQDCLGPNEAVMATPGGLEKLYLVSSHNESILLETILEDVAIFAPPLLVQLLHHDLIDDQIITHPIRVSGDVSSKSTACGQLNE